MTRRQFVGWVDAMNKQIEGADPDPNSWEGTQNDPHWEELRRKRDEARGR